MATKRNLTIKRNLRLFVIFLSRLWKIFTKNKISCFALGTIFLLFIIFLPVVYSEEGPLATVALISIWIIPISISNKDGRKK